MNGTNRRAWVKNAAIVFLVILLLLTFFSNTILNHSLPEVSAQYVRSDTITNAIKVSGTVKANESFAVIYDEADEDMQVANPGQTRKIVSVYVSRGSFVNIGDPIMALKGGASRELEQAEAELKELEKQYNIGKLEDSIASLSSAQSLKEKQTELDNARAELASLKELYNVLLSGNDPTDALKQLKKENEKEAEQIRKQINKINEKIADIEAELSQAESVLEGEDKEVLSLNERYLNAKKRYESLKADYEAAVLKAENLQEMYDDASGMSAELDEAYQISQQIKSLKETLEDLQKQLSRLQEDSIIADYEAKIAARDAAEAALRAHEESVGAGNEEWSFLSAQLTIAERELKEAKDAYEQLLAEGKYAELENFRGLEDLNEQIADTEKELKEAYTKLNILGMPYIDDITDYYVDNGVNNIGKQLEEANKQLAKITEDYEEAKSEYEALAEKAESADSVSTNTALLEAYENELATYEDRLDTVNEKIADIEEDLSEAAGRKDPEDVAKQIEELEISIAAKETALAIDKITGEKNNTETSYTRQEQEQKINELKEKIEAMKNAPAETVITAPIAGRIVSMDFVPGNSITSGTQVTSIEVADKGYTCEVTMTTVEAARLQIGMECSIVDSWQFNNVKATISQIKNDTSSQGKNKIVVITLNGDVSEGLTMNFSIGDKSQYYDTVLPNSAIREDSEGKFVLVVESKKTPLGIRYTAVRKDIEVIISDNTKSAVSGINYSEFVIISSQKPLDNGQQVRLADN
ncbi:MAG: HlyD family efflux transporter periplasmic adaptor subunit [Ruminococcaceae bacterium]|nr:HlyD family efflux transporter periplasmic adaptor subunit [Oscillospiraceae bacterium]